MEKLDQILVIAKHWIVGWGLWPEAAKPWLSIVISIAPLIGFFALLFGITTVLERKGLGRIQNRLGPNRVGPAGFLQFVCRGGTGVCHREHTADAKPRSELRPPVWGQDDLKRSAPGIDKPGCPDRPDRR